jgi:transcriptional repressor NrdR
MICPKCSADTRVIDSRPHEDDPGVIRRRRECVSCRHRFFTQEGTINIAGMRAKRRRAQAVYLSRLDPEVKAARIAASNLRRDAKFEAAETGRPLADVLAAWGVAAPSRPASPNP